MRVRVIGLGTRRGDDAAGLLAAEALAAESWPVPVDVLRCESTGPDLLDALGGAEAVVLVDAMRTGRPPGTVREIAREELSQARSMSSHGMGVAETLRLAAGLGRAPSRVAIVGIEGARTEGDVPSPEVRAAIAGACGLVRGIIAKFLEEAA